MRPHGRVVRCGRIGSLGPRPTTAESRSTSDVPCPIGGPCRGSSSSITSPAGRRSPRSRGSAGTSRADAKSRPTPWAALEEAFAEDERAQAHGEPIWLPSERQRRPGRTGVLPRATLDRFLPPTGSRGDLTDHRHRPLHPRRGDVRTRCSISVRSTRGIEVTRPNLCNFQGRRSRPRVVPQASHLRSAGPPIQASRNDTEDPSCRISHTPSRTASPR
jgi:hypothetical protein